MKNNKCPTRKRCFDYGNCDGCDIGNHITKLHKRIDRLKKQNETLTIQRNAWALTAKAMENKWISVDERLPEDDLSEEHEKKTIKVLVAIKAKNGITIRTQERFRDYTYSNVGDPIIFWTWRFSHGKVTHWMPLPEPPMLKGGE